MSGKIKDVLILKNSMICLIMMVSLFVVALLVKVNAKENALGEWTETPKDIVVNADSLVEFAKSLQGKKYCYGSCTPGSGFDCSGFVYYVFSQFKVTLPRSSPLMAEKGKEIKLANSKKGDLIFFTGTDPEVREVGHVGIIISDKGQPVEFIHCSSGKKNGVVITSMSSSHYQKRFLKVKRMEL